jgi:hypothetical protein
VDNFKLRKTLNLKPALLAMDKPMGNFVDNLAYGCVCPQSCPQVLPTARAFDHKLHRFKITTSFTFIFFGFFAALRIKKRGNQKT